MGGENSVPTLELMGQKYEIGRPLGKGSYGKVFAVRHSSTKRWKVVKEMHKGYLMNTFKGAVKQLIQERKILSLLSGCNFVPKLYLATQNEDFLYLLMDYFSGGELDYHLQHFKYFAEDIVIHWIAHLTVGLEQIHRAGVIHRDLKPANILLDSKGYASIIDFNFAVLLDPSDLNDPNSSHSTVGTLSYISPELLSGKPYNEKVDWWSLGVIAYQLTHGDVPWYISFKSGLSDADFLTDYKSLLAFIKSNPTIHYSRRCSQEFILLIQGLMNVDPNARFGVTEIKNHPLYKDFDWKSVYEKNTCVPFLPDSENVHYNPTIVLEEHFGLNEYEKYELTEEDQKLFEEWDWINQIAPKTLTALEEDILYFNNTNTWTDGVLLFDGFVGQKGKIFFKLDDIPTNNIFYTERGNSIEKISPKTIKVGDQKIQL